MEPAPNERFPDLRPGDERTALGQRLDYHRRTVIRTIEGLDDAQAAARALDATDLTVGGIVKHLAWAEDHWFQARLVGREMPEPWASALPPDDRDWPFRSAQHDSVASLVDLYAEACERSRTVTNSFGSLDVVAARPSFGKGPVNLRWILVHMIDETACHTGHLDLLRDAITARGT